MIERLFAPMAMKAALLLQLLSLGAIGLLLLAKASETRRADKWHARAGEEAAAHRLTIAEVQRVRAEQVAKDITHARQVERAQVQISEEVSRDYQVALADLRRRYDALRVRTGATTDNQGGSGDADMPRVSHATGGIDGTTAEEGFPIADQFLCSAQAWQLEALQNWVSIQQRVSR